jgi:hypothetical protein
MHGATLKMVYIINPFFERLKGSEDVEIWVYYKNADEDSSLLECYATLISKYLLIFQRRVAWLW